MKIEFQSPRPNVLYAKPQGRIDAITAADFGEMIGEKLDDIEKLLLDFSEVEYVSSMGLRVILDLQKLMKAQGDMIIAHVKPNVLEIFTMTGFDKILDIM